MCSAGALRGRPASTTATRRRSVPVGPHVTAFEQMAPILATGEAVSPVHAQAVHSVHDAPPARWAPVWRTAAESELIRAFAETVEEHRPADL